MFWLLILLVWIICGIFAYGLTFPDFQYTFVDEAKQDYYVHLILAIVMGICGIVGLVVTCIVGGITHRKLKWR